MCDTSLIYNMSRACVLDNCDGGDDYGDMCGNHNFSFCYIPNADQVHILVIYYCRGSTGWEMLPIQ